MYILSNFHHICTQAKRVSDRNQEIFQNGGKHASRQWGVFLIRTRRKRSGVVKA